MFEKIMSLFFPKVCGICYKKINRKYTCEKCGNILKYTIRRELYIRKIVGNLDELISLFKYSGIIRDRILKFKFYHMAFIGNSFAELMCEIIRNYGIQFDLIIPVPIHKSRYRIRGYNQSEIIARFISKELGVRQDVTSLIKKRHNLKQSILTKEQRKKNVLNVYEITSNKKIDGKSILLVDDIYTTGATANECAKMLKKNGAKKVICITIAYGSYK